MSHLARGPMHMGLDSKASAAGCRHLGVCSGNVGKEAAP